MALSKKKLREYDDKYRVIQYTSLVFILLLFIQFYLKSNYHKHQYAGIWALAYGLCGLYDKFGVYLWFICLVVFVWYGRRYLWTFIKYSVVKFPGLLKYFKKDKSNNIVVKKEESHKLILGTEVNNKNNIIYWDFKRVPHLALSIPTGGGKTSLFRHLIRQIKESNIQYQIIILDVKSHSYMDLESNDIAVCWEMNDIISILRSIVTTMNAYYSDRRSKGKQVLNNIPHIFLVFEELNAMSSRLKNKDMNLYKEFKGYLTDLILLGREAKIHILLGAQRLSIEALGSGDLRENFKSFIIGDPSKNAWDMLVGNTIPYPNFDNFDNINELTCFIDKHHKVIPIVMKQFYLED